MIYIPADRSNRAQEFQMLMQGIQQLGQGLGAIKQVKEERANEAFLEQIRQAMQSGDPNALNQAISQPPQAGPGGLASFFDKLNPNSPSLGRSPLQQGIMGRQAAYATDPYQQARFTAETNRGEYWKNKGETLQDVDADKLIATINKRLAVLGNIKKPLINEVSGTPLAGNERRVTKIDAQKKQLENQLSELTGTALTEEEQAAEQAAEQAQNQAGQNMDRIRVGDPWFWQKGGRSGDILQAKRDDGEWTPIEDSELSIILQGIMPGLDETQRTKMQKVVLSGNTKVMREVLTGFVNTRGR